MKSRHGTDRDFCWALVAFLVQRARNQPEGQYLGIADVSLDLRREISLWVKAGEVMGGPTSLLVRTPAKTCLSGRCAQERTARGRLSLFVNCGSYGKYRPLL
jgi:hypothetical protein